ncbi:E3 ubiquitin-protein ligase ZSWIM2 isoform X1 [Anas acuta]|uniref:E3 ubiquitin-protein ligase ZSWIM2 isoform X1 n=1 Tax=Anas acuta TaxID=28680 RepID=UPI0035C8D816
MAGRRQEAGAALRRRQERALRGTMRVVRELGPAAFLLQEDGRRGPPLRVLLGAPHSCSCGTARAGAGLCEHLCWILLKKYRLPRDHEYACKSGLLEREIEEILERLHQKPTQNAKQTLLSQTPHEEHDRCIHQKEIDKEDVCPICQEELLKKMLPITYCRYSCGNNVHIKCMKIWADHQDETEKDSVVKCPLCREKFAPLKLILEEFRNSNQLVTATEKARLDTHLGIPCNNCRVFPIVGKCYKCTECADYHLCHECFIGFCHSPHVFLFRQKRNKKWRALEQLSELSAQEGTYKSFNPANNSEEKLLYLQKTTCTPKNIVKSLPVILVSKHSNLLAPGIQCRLCLKSFHLGQYVRLLPCNHKFHRECIDCWLLQRKNTCPIDEYVIYNPLTWKDTPAKQENFPAGSHTSVKKLVKQGKPEICVSGSQIYLKQGSSAYTSGRPESSFKKLSNNSVPETQKDLRSFSDLHLGNSDPNSSRTLCNFPRHGKDISLSSCDAAFSVKSSTIRKADIHNAFRSPHWIDCSKTRKVFPIRKDDCDNSTNERYPRELNLKINLCATSHSSKKGSKDMGNTSHQQRLLTKRLPKDNHLNFKQTKTDLLLEGIPLHASSRFPYFK